MKFPLLGKTLAVGGVLVALTLALQSISAIVGERQSRLQEAERSVADSLASQQSLVGPVLMRRCEERWTAVQGEGKERKTVVERNAFPIVAIPNTLDVKAKAVIEPRHRGIFTVNGYQLRATMQAQWQGLDGLEPAPQRAGGTVRCEAPVMFVAVGDARGIRVATISVGGTALPVLPGTGHESHPHGFHVAIPAALLKAGGPLQAEVALDLVGTGDLAFAPVAETTRVTLASNWPHPSFVGRFLPNERTVTPQGFDATWQLSALATAAPRQLADAGAVCGAADRATATAACIENFGVAFIDPVSAYVLSDRATKYGLLFIALTFVGVGLIEVLKRLRVHPLQYLLVGSAIAVFFLLLVSLTEHIAFGWAYLAAASACTLLLGFYGSFVLHGARAGAVFGAAIGALYGVLYLLLQMEQSALVLGSLLLFTVLTGVMVATRRVDWYTLIDSLRTEPRPAAVPAA